MMKLLKIFMVLIFLIGIVFYVGWQELRGEVLNSKEDIYYGFRQAKEALLGFRPDQAANHFAQIKEEIDLLQKKLPPLTNFIPLLKNLPPIFADATSITQAATELSQKLDFLKKNGTQLVFEKRGKELISLLRQIRSLITTINESTSNLSRETSRANLQLKEISSVNAELYKTGNFLDAFISWLDTPRPRNLLVMFQNPSEIRPGGGFLGSFGQITLRRGSLVGLEVNDIYDFDGQLDQKIIPPLQLQSITKDWEARDANWFFDFPTSARKTIEFLEKSKIYQERAVKFDGAIAINVNILNDILEIVGPIILWPKTANEFVVSVDNFLEQIQREVETKQNKNILKELTPIIFERLSNLNEDQKNLLVEKMKGRIDKKDLMIYLNDLILGNFMASLGVAGEVAALPPDFFGDYLAVVNTNVAGGKTDAVISQQIEMAAKINDAGEVTNDLTITRRHNGGAFKDRWYNATNQNYLQVLTVRDSKLIEMSGGDKKEIKPLIDYKKEGYEKDEDLTAIESGEQFGKSYFSTWTYTKPNETSQIKLTYKIPSRFWITTHNKFPTYNFVFDKQSGIESSFQYSIEAPPGFIWRETNGPYFIYKNEVVPKRLIIELNLIKIARSQ